MGDEKKFSSLKVELEKKADKDKSKSAAREEAVETFKAELDVQKASLNSDILAEKRAIKRVKKEQNDAIYTFEPNLELYDELVAKELKLTKKLNHLETVHASRVAMANEMV